MQTYLSTTSLPLSYQHVPMLDKNQINNHNNQTTIPNHNSNANISLIDNSALSGALSFESSSLKCVPPSVGPVVIPNESSLSSCNCCYSLGIVILLSELSFFSRNHSLLGIIVLLSESSFSSRNLCSSGIVILLSELPSLKSLLLPFHLVQS